MKEIKNPLSQLLGIALQNMRNTEGGGSSENVATALGVSPSAYRMIEAGSANLNPNKAFLLIAIPCFQSIRFEKLCKLIVSIHIVEPLLANSEKVISALNNDDELSSLFTLNNQTIQSLIESTQDFKQYLSRTDTIEKVKAFLQRQEQLNSNRLLKELDNIEQNTPSIFNDIIESSIKQFRLEIDNIAKIADMEKRINDLRRKVEELNMFQLRFNYDNSLAWRQGKQFIATRGVFFDFQNLNNPNILEKYKDNFTQLWKPHFNNLNYLVISDDKMQVATIIKKFKELLKTMIYKEIKDELNTISFEEGLAKFDYCVVPTNEPSLKKLGIEGENKELWIYQIDENRNYAFLNRRTKREKDLPEEAFGYQFLSNQKVKEYNISFYQIWQTQKLNNQT